MYISDSLIDYQWSGRETNSFQWLYNFYLSMTCTSCERYILLYHCQNVIMSIHVRPLQSMSQCPSGTLTPCITSLWIAMVLIIKEKWVHVFQQEGYQLPAQSQCRKNYWKYKCLFMFPQNSPAHQGLTHKQWQTLGHTISIVATDALVL